MDPGDAVDRNFQIAGGEPIFRGTRVPVRLLREYLDSGRSVDAFLQQHPTVTRAQAAAILAIGFAAAPTPLASTARLRAMPTLSDVAARPELADHLPGSTAGLLALEATALVQRLTVRAVVAPPRLATEAEDRLLDTRRAAEMLGMSVISLQHKARQDPWRGLLVDNGTRLLRWSRWRIEAFLATPPARGASSGEPDPAPAPQIFHVAPNRRRRPKEF